MLKFLLKAILVVVLVIIAIVVIAKFALDTDSKTTTAPIETTTETMYVLSTYDGRIALYKSGYSMPVEIYDVFLDSFPPEEQENLKKGISAQNDEQALRLVEDYTS